MKIVDIHTHLFQPEVHADRGKYGKTDPGFALLYDDPESRMVTAEQLIETMDEDDIDVSVACAFPWRDTGAAAETSDYLIESEEKFPERIRAFICPPLTTPREVERELGRLQGRKFSGFGEWRT